MSVWLVKASEDDAGDEVYVTDLLVTAESRDEAIAKVADMGWCVFDAEGPEPTVKQGQTVVLAYELGTPKADHPSRGPQ